MVENINIKLNKKVPVTEKGILNGQALMPQGKYKLEAMLLKNRVHILFFFFVFQAALDSDM